MTNALRPVVESLDGRRLLSVSAVDDHLSTPAGTPATVSDADLLANDSGANVVQGVTQPAHGVVTHNADGTVTYTPNPGFSGQDQFTYTAADAHPVLSIDAPEAVAASLAAKGFAAAAAPTTPLYNPGQIVVSSYQFGMTRTDQGQVVFAPLHITAANGIASPGLFSALANGIRLGSITLTTKDSLGRDALAFTFQNVVVSEYANAGDGGENTDSVEFAFQSLAISYTAYNPDGTARPPIRASIDRAAGTLTTAPFAAGSDLTHAAAPPPEILSFGASKDVRVDGTDFTYGSNAGDLTSGTGGAVFNYGPFVVQSTPNLESVPLISFLLFGGAVPAASYTARDPDTGVVARFDLQASTVASYGISGDASGAAVETYGLRPIAVTESFSRPAAPPHSATWNAATRAGTTTADLGTLSVADPRQSGDLLTLDPSDPAATGGLVAVDRYSMGFDNEQKVAGQLAFQPLEFQTDFGPHSPGLLTSTATGARFGSLTLTHRDAAGTVTSTLAADTAVVSSVRDTSDGAGHIDETVDAIYGRLRSSVARPDPVGPPVYYTGSWDKATGTGTGDFVGDDSSPAPSAAVTQGTAAPQGIAPQAVDPRADTLDIEPPVGHPGSDAVLNVLNGSWTADQNLGGIDPATGQPDLQAGADFGSFVFTAPLDVQTPGLIYVIGNDSLIRRITYTARDAGGNVAAQYALGNCQIYDITVVGEDAGGPARVVFKVAFGSIAQVVAPSTTPGVKTAGVGWDRVLNQKLDVTDPTYGVTTPAAQINQNPGFGGQQLPVPDGSSTLMSFQVGPTANPQIDGQLASAGFTLGASDLPAGPGDGFKGLQFDDLVVNVSKSGPSLGLLQYLLNGQVLNKVTITSRDESKRAYAVYTLRNVVVAGYDESTGAGETPVEQFHLRYQTLDLTYTPYSASGAVQPPLTVSVNDGLNTATGTGTPGVESIANPVVRPTDFRQSLTFGTSTLAAGITSAAWDSTSSAMPVAGPPGSGAGRAALSDVTFTADTDSTSAYLLGRLAGVNLGDVLYTVRDGAGRPLIQYTFESAAVTSVEFTGDASVRSETRCTLAYQKVAVKNFQNKPDGTLARINTYAWDRVADVPTDGSTAFADFAGSDAGAGTVAAASTRLLAAAAPADAADVVHPSTATVFVDVVGPNQPPTANAGGPYAAVAGGSVRLDGTASADDRDAPADLTYAWDLDGDSLFGETGVAAGRGDEVGPTPTFDVGPLDGPQSFAVKLRVTDRGGLASTDATAAVNIANAAPTAAPIAGPTDRNIAQAGTFTFGAAGFDYVVKWGDGSASTAVHAGPATSANHAYATPGVYTISYTARDKDGGTSATVARAVTVAGAKVVADPTDPSATALYVGGTSGNDAIVVDKGTGSSALKVTLNGVVWGTFAFTGNVFVFGQAGNDAISIVKQVDRDAFVYGGAGNDAVSSGNGRTVMIGGDGDDALTGGNGADVLIGGRGADALGGNNGDDLLVAGFTAYDDFGTANAIALRSLRNEWTANSYAARVQRLLGQVAGSAFVFRTAGPNQNVFADASADNLAGGNGDDWFVATVAGVKDLTDRKGAEVSTGV